MGLIKGDTRSLDYSSDKLALALSLQDSRKTLFPLGT